MNIHNFKTVKIDKIKKLPFTRKEFYLDIDVPVSRMIIMVVQLRHFPITM